MSFVVCFLSSGIVILQMCAVLGQFITKLWGYLYNAYTQSVACHTSLCAHFICVYTQTHTHTHTHTTSLVVYKLCAFIIVGNKLKRSLKFPPLKLSAHPFQTWSRNILLIVRHSSTLSKRDRLHFWYFRSPHWLSSSPAPFLRRLR